MIDRICLVTQGHLATCPRIRKAATAIAANGTETHVVSANYIPWAIAGDDVLGRQHGDEWESWTIVDWSRAAHPFRYAYSAIRYRLAALVTRAAGIDRAPLSMVKRARERSCTELERAVAATRPQLVYGGGAALASTASVARRLGVPYALDLEDFHSAEGDDSRMGRWMDALARRIERDVLPGAAFLTAGSPAIAAAYEEAYGVRVLAVNNTFPLPSPPVLDVLPDPPLKLYWFSQTIGPGRGLEDVVHAAGRVDLDLRLSVRGRPQPGYVESLQGLARDVAPRLELVVLPTEPPDTMIDLCREHDVGLALERPVSRNATLLLSNKALTYLVAGVAVVATRTTGHEALASDLGDHAVWYEPGDVDALARGIERWARDPVALRDAKQTAWSAAVGRWHWEHRLERGALLAAVAGVGSDSGT